MRALLCETADEFSSKNDGQNRPATDKTVRTVTRINGQRLTFRDLAKFAWPQKTEQFLSHITGYDARTCRRWLANQTEPPAEALGAILQEIMRCYRPQPGDEKP